MFDSLVASQPSKLALLRCSGLWISGGLIRRIVACPIDDFCGDWTYLKIFKNLRYDGLDIMSMDNGFVIFIMLFIMLILYILYLGSVCTHNRLVIMSIYHIRNMHIFPTLRHEMLFIY